MSIKEQMHKLVDSLPEQGPDAIEEMHYRLYVLEKIERGLRELDAGSKMSDEHARRELARWLTD